MAFFDNPTDVQIETASGTSTVVTRDDKLNEYGTGPTLHNLYRSPLYNDYETSRLGYSPLPIAVHREPTSTATTRGNACNVLIDGMLCCWTVQNDQVGVAGKIYISDYHFGDILHVLTAPTGASSRWGLQTNKAINGRLYVGDGSAEGGYGRIYCYNMYTGQLLGTIAPSGSAVLYFGNSFDVADGGLRYASGNISTLEPGERHDVLVVLTQNKWGETTNTDKLSYVQLSVNERNTTWGYSYVAGGDFPPTTVDNMFNPSYIGSGAVFNRVNVKFTSNWFFMSHNGGVFICPTSAHYFMSSTFLIDLWGTVVPRPSYQSTNGYFGVSVAFKGDLIAIVDNTTKGSSKGTVYGSVHVFQVTNDSTVSFKLDLKLIKNLSYNTAGKFKLQSAAFTDDYLIVADERGEADISEAAHYGAYPWKNATGHGFHMYSISEIYDTNIPNPPPIVVSHQRQFNDGIDCGVARIFDTRFIADETRAAKEDNFYLGTGLAAQGDRLVMWGVVPPENRIGTTVSDIDRWAGLLSYNIKGGFNIKESIDNLIGR